MNYRMIARIPVGRILVAVAATMLAPLGLSLLYGESISFGRYVIPIAISVLIGGFVYLQKRRKIKAFTDVTECLSLR